MLFSASPFLFLFLPLFALAYLTLPWKNAVLLAASLLFYGWGEPIYIALLVAVCLGNWWAGLAIDAPGADATRRKRVLFAAVAVNVLALGVFKYTGFVLGTVQQWVGVPEPELIRSLTPPLPLGVSFFIFQAITYVVDIYRGDLRASKSPADVTLYISMFPQLIAGPIVRYSEVGEQLHRRSTDTARVASGYERFIIGLAKKVLVADLLAGPVDSIFSLPQSALTPVIVWFGAVCFAMQILFDFSGYTDMAIGMARAMGFDFPENFDDPYRASSMRDFWRRWHMTLSRWFRDYVYIPLGGSHCPPWRTYANLLAVFLLTGAWHGASWNFVLWGVIHGGFLMIERGGLDRRLARGPRWLSLGYVWLVVLVGWVWFRCTSLEQGWVMTLTMFDVTRWGVGWDQLWRHAQPLEMFVLAAACVLSLGGPWVTGLLPRHTDAPGGAGVEDGVAVAASPSGGAWVAATRVVFFMALAVVAVTVAVASTQQAFIYFRF